VKSGQGKPIPRNHGPLAFRCPQCAKRSRLAVVEQANAVRRRDGALLRARQIALTGVTAADALERIGLDYNLTYEVMDSRTLRISAPRLSGVDGVSNPKLLEKFKAQLVYPEEARANRVEGSVILQAVIRKDGRVGNIQLLRGVPDHPEFAASAIEAVRQWQYEPAELDGQPVDVFFTIFAEFKLD